MKIDEALEKLYSLHKFGVKLGLDNIIRLLHNLGNPEKNFRAIHIAGSNGKGSVASFLASILMESGKKVGLYTSPHFVRFNERVKINGKEIEDEYIAKFMTGLDDYVQGFNPTFFEVTTGLAFKYFAEKGVDVAVIETGLGGRLDATNTINPLASVITTISYEHTNILGESLELIAKEKAGIIKENTPLFLGLLPQEAENEIVKIAKEKKAGIFLLKNFLTKGKNFVKIEKGDFTFTIYRTGLRGSYQLINSALAVLTANVVFNISDYKIISNALLNVVRNTGFQGRYEVYFTKPKVIFDAAHNAEGVEVFLSEFEKEKDCEKKILIFGAMKDKNIEVMLKKMSGYFDKIYLTTIEYERAASIEELQEICDIIGVKASAVENASDIIEKFIRNNSKDCLVILGSIYILGNIKGKLLAKLDI